MIAVETQRLDGALGPATRIPQVPQDLYTVDPSSPQTRFLDSHPFFRRSPFTTDTPSPQSLAKRSSSSDTIRASTLYAENEPPPRYTFIDKNNVSKCSLKIRPPSPNSPISSFIQSPSSESGQFGSTQTPSRHIPIDISRYTCSEYGPKKVAPTKSRPRHIPIIIPPYTGADFEPEKTRVTTAKPKQPRRQPREETLERFGPLFPPTPETSAESTPQGSLRGVHSCAQLIQKMSRPATSGSRASTLDSSGSALSPDQSHDESFKPTSSSYLADTNSSSDSSLNQAVQEAPVHVENINDPRLIDSAAIASAGSPQLISQTPTSANPTQNLSGLVCNVHKCTGKEPHGLVGATTTILGDKLYVLGGRVLSKKRPYLTSDIHELDLIKRHWTKLQVKGDIPGPRYFHSVCPLGDTKLICYGGMSPAPSQAQGGNMQQTADPNGEMAVMSDIHVFDAPSRTWTHISIVDTPPGRYAHCAAVLPSTAIFSSPNAPLSAILHNPPSSVPNQGSLGVAIDGSGGSEMIVVGGQDSNNKYIDAVSVFNLRSLKWTDTQSLPRSCGAYRSVVTPLTGLSPLKIGAGPDQEEVSDGVNGATEKVEPTTSMLIYSNYNFLDVKLELQVRMPNGTLVEKMMKGPVSPPGLRFPNGDVFDNHFIVSGTYLTSSKHEYALWALDLRTLEWSRIDAGGGIFSQGSWNRGILWARRNTFVILGNRKRSLVDDYNHRRINFSNICMVELEAFGLYDNPRRLAPTSNYKSISAPIVPSTISYKNLKSGGRPLSSAAVELGAMAMNIRDLADMDLVAISGEKIPVNSYMLSQRWGAFFTKLLRESGGTFSTLSNDAASSSDGGTLRPGHLNASASLASRNSSITITPSIQTSHSVAPSSVTAISSNSGSTTTGLPTTFDPPTPQNLPAPTRARQLYLPHTLLTLRALVHYLYTSSLPAPNHHLCTPQILCSLLQLARPYRIDGLLEATVERLHQILDGRNAAAVFNAAAMAAGGGRGTGTAFGKEGEDPAEDGAGGLTITKLALRNATVSEKEETSESETDSSSVISSETGSSVGGMEETPTTATATVPGGKKVLGEEQIWSGGVSCVVGLQKRGLRGLMEGRRIREKERGRAVGGLASPNLGQGIVNGGHAPDVNGASAAGGGQKSGVVGLGIG